MVREKKTRKLGDLRYDTMADLIRQVDAVIKENPELTYESFSVETDYDGCYYEGDHPSVCFEYETEETDHEMAYRIEQARIQLALQEEYERQTLVRLQAKYDTVKIRKPPTF